MILCGNEDRTFKEIYQDIEGKYVILVQDTARGLLRRMAGECVSEVTRTHILLLIRHMKSKNESELAEMTDWIRCERCKTKEKAMNGTDG